MPIAFLLIASALAFSKVDAVINPFQEALESDVTVLIQISVAVGAVIKATSHSAVTSASIATSATGPVTSSISTFCVCVVVLPLPSS